MATTDDLTEMATKDDLTKMATKDDLALMEKGIQGKMATKDDLTSMEKNIKDDITTKLGQSLGPTIEFQGRQVAARSFGESFAKQSIVKALEGLVQILCHGMENEADLSVVELTQTQAAELIERNVAATFLRDVWTLLKASLPGNSLPLPDLPSPSPEEVWDKEDPRPGARYQLTALGLAAPSMHCPHPDNFNHPLQLNKHRPVLHCKQLPQGVFTLPTGRTGRRLMPISTPAASGAFLVGGGWSDKIVTIWTKIILSAQVSPDIWR